MYYERGWHLERLIFLLIEWRDNLNQLEKWGENQYYIYRLTLIFCKSDKSTHFFYFPHFQRLRKFYTIFFMSVYIHKSHRGLNCERVKLTTGNNFSFSCVMDNVVGRERHSFRKLQSFVILHPNWLDVKYYTEFLLGLPHWHSVYYPGWDFPTLASLFLLCSTFSLHVSSGVIPIKKWRHQFDYILLFDSIYLLVHLWS